ncbi:beta-ketoacyl-ACP synthase II [Roseicella aquatilis]|uniref:3-oxoacyl-[acyl-carrier-protein] synthase 2 n=1 Tax=Roseicella aquatilis TaxID=2527868 RepID=A0A4R4DH98_9PROT|nr:beta-ketoacyl-ACP synthase II [Roseicella aquatilis]TCZ59685.1 beta-ketoacyl-[acyl-carrier-protein] synthase II [Roseicella aquatilis]
MRRVVVTGMGIVCPLGMGVGPVWRRLLAGQSGIGAITAFNSDGLPCRIAGQVPSGIWSDLPRPDGNGPGRGNRVGRLALIAARHAVEDAGWRPRDEAAQDAAGVSIGSGCGGLEAIHEGAQRWHPAAEEHGMAHVLPGAMIHQLATDVAQAFGLHGPRRAVSTACSSGAHAIGDAARLVALGDADVMLAGGAEAAVCELGIAGFAAARALSSAFNDAPGRASRPWDRDRDGFVMGEGAGMLLLEEREHARRRGARIYAELSGYGMSGDAHHVTAPAEGHAGAWRAMRNALRDAGATVEEVGYINAHGTSTPLGDDLELDAVERLFGPAAQGLAMSSTKSATGHMLGAAGAAEAIFSVLAIHEGVVPPTLNLDAPSRRSVIDRVAWCAQERPVRAALSNSFGFGGTNASILFRAA